MSNWIKKSRVALVCLFCVASVRLAAAQAKDEPRFVSDPQTFPLWEHGAPGASGDRDEDKPTLTYYSPLRPSDTRTAIIVAPGGVRLYFSERGTIKQTSVDGGGETEIHTGLNDLDLYDISPHGSALLVGAGVQGSPTVERPVWIVSLPAGTPIQVGNIKALWTTWVPDGEHLAYTTNDGAYITKKDGTQGCATRSQGLGRIG